MDPLAEDLFQCPAGRYGGDHLSYHGAYQCPQYEDHQQHDYAVTSFGQSILPCGSLEAVSFQPSAISFQYQAEEGTPNEAAAAPRRTKMPS